MKAILIVAVVAVIGGGGTLLVRSTRGPAGSGDVPAGMLFTAARGKLTVTITENGSLMAKNSEKITFTARGGGKIAFLVEEGKTVEENEVLCRIETTELEKRIEKLKLDILKTGADLDSAKTELEIQGSENVANVEKSKFALTKAKNELEKYRDGDAPKQRRELEIKIKESRTKFSRAKKKYEDSSELLVKEFINKAQFEQDEIDFERAEIQMEGARKDLALFEKYTEPMTMTEKQTGLSDAERGRGNAEKRAKSILRKKEVAVESYTRRLATLKESLAEREKELESFTIRSPSPGIVLYGDPSQPWYRENIKLGGRLWGGVTVFTIPDLRVMKVQIEVHEADINKLKVDQVATVTMDTYPGLVLSGKVSKIASIAGKRGGGRNEEVKKFTVEVILDSTKDQILKPGISAKAEIFVEERDDVVYVPIQSVFLEKGRHFSYVMNEQNQPIRVEVKPEINNETYIQIVEGIEPGDQVLLYNPALRAQAEAVALQDKPDVAVAGSTVGP